MKKKIVAFVIASVAVLGLSGCGGGGGDDYYPDDRLTTLYLVDEFGNSYYNVPYRCDSMSTWRTTPPNGEFTFIQPESCEFDFLGLDGNLFNDPRVDDIVRIVDYTNDGKGGIPYQCTSFGASTTYGDGSFEYDINDECVFYL